MALPDQIKRNTLALISLFVAFSALGYNTWRNEATEENRNIRKAGFELIVHIGALQRISYLAQFEKKQNRGNPRLGWTEVLLIRDLSHLLPGIVQQKSENLMRAWEQNWLTLGESNEIAVSTIDSALNDLRIEVLDVIRALD